MYGDFFLVEQHGSPVRRASRLPFGDTAGRNEAWLRDLIFAHPELLPLSDIDPSFGPLIPLCRELRTGAGPLDLAFVNPAGRLTLIECKLWRNPEARRKVVAQVLDYARVIARWTYSDLQRQVSAATGRSGNVPFEIARSLAPELVEHHFIDAVTQTMRSGRFLLLIAGDGIREDVGAIAELINRNAALGFSFGLVEVALYGIEGAVSELIVQPRVVARTQIIERGVVLLRGGSPEEFLGTIDDTIPQAARLASASASGFPISSEASAAPRTEGEGARQAEYRQWWQPVLGMVFDDPDQEPPRLYYPNNVRAQLSLPGTWVTAFRSADRCGVFLAGRQGALDEAWGRLSPDLEEIKAELPKGTALPDPSTHEYGLTTERQNGEFSNDDEKRRWLAQTLNAYVNALRPRLRAWPINRLSDISHL